MYIGEKKIKGTMNTEDGRVTVGFTDNSPDITLSKSLFDSVKSKKKGRGNVTDNVNHYFASKFLWELSQEGMEYYMVENVALSMKTLAHNMREDLIRNTFNCGGADSIDLGLLVRNIYGDNQQEEDSGKEEE